ADSASPASNRSAVTPRFNDSLSCSALDLATSAGLECWHTAESSVSLAPMRMRPSCCAAPGLVPGLALVAPAPRTLPRTSADIINLRIFASQTAGRLIGRQVPDTLCNYRINLNRG